MSNRPWAVIGIVCLFVAALLVDGRTPGDVEQPKPAESLTESDVDRIARRVERLRDLEFKKPVEPLFLSREQATGMAREAGRSNYTAAERREDEEAIKLVGLMGAEESLEEAFGAVEGEQILGFYDPRSKRMVVIEGPSASRALLEVTLAHELTHALEDQHFGLREPEGGTDDEELAESSMIEGSATELMSRYAERHVPASELLEVAFSAGATSELPEYVENALTFPYLKGQEFVGTFIDPPGGERPWASFDSLMKGKRPVSTEQVLHPRRYALDERPRPVSMPDVAAAVGDDWERVDQTGVGEFDLTQMFELLGDGPDPSAAEGWGGGRFALWRRKGERLGDCDAPCVESSIGVLRVVWDTAADAREAERELKPVIERGLKGERTLGRGTFGFWSSRGGVVGMSTGRRSTTIVFAPTQALAAQVLAERR